ncbi:hypothetical protein EIP86_005846 [Pleurotus ostreatoroseus]|nr:hypothetical protein EIP86_005846 [Pleurotus ostreatoroseus]
MASTAPFGALSVALAQAITYLTRTLITRYSATTIIKLQLALEANLTAQFEPSWVSSEPLRGSGRRCLTLSPHCAPPRAIYNACKVAGVEWSVWASLLGGVEFDLFIDPGCVSIRFGNWDTGKVGKFFTVWSQEVPESQTRAPSPLESKTVAQQIILADEDEDDELFAILSDEIREPTWLTPIASQFPRPPSPPRSLSSSPISVMSALSSHSRTSSCSSVSSGADSIFSQRTNNSYGSATTISLSSSASSCSTSPDEEKPKFKLSRRERARQAKVFIDTTRTDVTNYDGGKTTVLTGGVMLGRRAQVKPAPAAPLAQKKPESSIAGSWRSLRA